LAQAILVQSVLYLGSVGAPCRFGPGRRPARRRRTAGRGAAQRPEAAQKMRGSMAGLASLLGFLLFGLAPHGAQAQIMSVDLGHEFFKVALMSQGKGLEIVLNSHSKRKTSTAVSFHEASRTFGDDALAHQGRAPAKVPMFFHSLLGHNFTEEDIKLGGKWWEKFGLGSKFYSYNLGFQSDRGAPHFVLAEGAEGTSDGEEVLASIFFAAKQMAEASGEGTPLSVRDLVVTMPSDASLRQRQAIVAAGEIAGLRVLTLVNEVSAFAVQRAVDYTPEKGSAELVLFFNLGSRKSEVSIVKFESKSAGMVAGRMAPVVTVLGSAIDRTIGGHLMDLKIAEVMLEKFQEKHPKLAKGILESPRALRKLLSQSQKTKAILSSNKVAPFIVESLFEDTDFQAKIKREEFEAMCKDMFAQLTVPIEKALKQANATMEDIQHIEVVGGGWRVPKVQQMLTEFAESGNKKLPLGQHLNGEEAGALGAALVAANASSSFRVKKIFFSDITHHEYSVQVVSLNGEWEKNVTTLYPVGAPLGQKKKLAFQLEEDFGIRLFEDGVLLHEYTFTGLTELMQGKWKEYNASGPVKISATVPLETSGLVEVKVPTATIEELYWVNVTKEQEKPKASKNATTDNATEDDNATDEAQNASANNSEADALEVVQKQKKRKHEKKLAMKRKDFLPLPLTEDQIAEKKKKLEGLAKQEAEAAAVAGIKNELEAAIYGSRDKLEREDIIQVTTEAQREEVIKMAADMEEWMYDTHSKSEYEEKLLSLQGLVEPMSERALELEARSGFDESVSERVAEIKEIQAYIAKNMSWVNENKTEAAAKKLDEFEEWWNKKKTQQESLPLNEAPAYTVKEVNEKLSSMLSQWEKLKKTKKPKEKKEAKPSKNATANATSGSEKAEATKAEELANDPAVVEKELEALRQKKAAAVENEEYDEANALKVKEQTLVKHLEKLKSEKTEL